jgi:hypothetical protein
MNKARPQPGQNHCERNIDVRITIDTSSLSRPHDQPGGTAQPTSIAHDQGFMIVTASRAVRNQGTGDVSFAADAGDTLRFFISSGSNNFEQPVLLESIRHVGGDEILASFTSQIVEQTRIAPGPKQVLPARFVRKELQLCQCVVAGDGTGRYELIFALYDCGEEAQLRRVGDYRWAMRLTAESNRRTP